MKILILAGGMGTRLGSLTSKIPKPMIMVHGKPMIIHIMESFSYYGYNDFVIALGYKGEEIKKYFNRFLIKKSEINKFSFSDSSIKSKNEKQNWNIDLIDTGLDSLTGKRIKLLENYFKYDDNFMMTYGDGLANVNIDKLLKLHLSNKKIATITAVRPPARFGELILKNNCVESFTEKQQMKRGWINGGYFVLNKKIFSYIERKKNFMFEKEPMNLLVKNKQIVAYKHHGYWQCVDTRRDLENINQEYDDNILPWYNR